MIEWNEIPVDIRELCSTQKLSPILAKLSDQQHTVRGQAETYYLLYTVRKCNKVVATSLGWSSNHGQQHLIDNGASFVIPITYPGWFQFIEEGKDHGAIPLRTIEQVAASKANVFLVHATITGYYQTDVKTPPKQLFDLQKVELPPGEVLAADSVYHEPTKKRRSFCPKLFRSKKSNVMEKTCDYLQCTDTCGRRILLPLDTKGRFSLIGNKPIGVKNEIPESNFVYQINDLVRRNDFPQTVRLVYGIRPPRSKEMISEPTFTGLLKLGEKYAERSLIACQIVPGDKLAFLEFPIDSGVKFLLAKDWEIVKSSVFKAANFCQEYVNSYKNEIQPLLDHIPDQLLDISDNWGAFGSGTLRRDKGLESRSKSNVESRSKSNQAREMSYYFDTKNLKEEKTVGPTKQTSSVSDTKVMMPNLRLKPLDSGKYMSSEFDCLSKDKISGSPKRKVPKLNAVAVDAEVHGHSRKSGISSDTKLQTDHNIASNNDNNKSNTKATLPLRERKLPPLPVVTSSESEINTNIACEPSPKNRDCLDPNILYEQIPNQRFRCYDPTDSAPATPAPRLNNGTQRKVITSSSTAYDANGYLIPTEYRKKQKNFENISQILRRCAEDIDGLKAHSDPGWMNSIFDLQTFSYERERMNLDLDAAIRKSNPEMQQLDYDAERLQSYLEDSLAELNRKRTIMLANHGMYNRNRNNSGTSSHSRKKVPKLKESPRVELPRSHEEVDMYLNTIFDCEDEDTEDDTPVNFQSTFQRSSSAGFCGKFNKKCAVRNTYNGFDTLSKADSGIASRQSTMQRIPTGWTCCSIEDTTWEPPTNLSSLTVEEVLMSLRYIGMKEQVVTSFGTEQVDGKLLCEMNDHLLSEGFPYMNSLEKKKVLDFIHGWRPKRMLFV